MLCVDKKTAAAFNADKCPRCETALVDPVAGRLLFVSCRGCRAVLRREKRDGRWSSEVVR